MSWGAMTAYGNTNARRMRRRAQCNLTAHARAQCNGARVNTAMQLCWCGGGGGLRRGAVGRVMHESAAAQCCYVRCRAAGGRQMQIRQGGHGARRVGGWRTAALTAGRALARMRMSGRQIQRRRRGMQQCVRRKCARRRHGRRAGGARTGAGGVRVMGGCMIMGRVSNVCYAMSCQVNGYVGDGRRRRVQRRQGQLEYGGYGGSLARAGMQGKSARYGARQGQIRTVAGKASGTIRRTARMRARLTAQGVSAHGVDGGQTAQMAGCKCMRRRQGAIRRATEIMLTNTNTAAGVGGGGGVGAACNGGVTANGGMQRRQMRRRQIKSEYVCANGKRRHASHACKRRRLARLAASKDGGGGMLE